MNKKIVALAVAAAFAIPAAASAQTTLFGQMKYEVGLIDNGDDRNAVHSYSGTRIGIMGSEDLGGGLKGIFRMQGAVGSEPTRGNARADLDALDELGEDAEFFDIPVTLSGAGSTANAPLGNSAWRLNEEVWVGVQGGFGTLQLGRSDTAFKKGHTRFRLFPDSLADLNNRPAGFNRAEGVHYSSPSFNGVTVNATLEPNGNKFNSYYALGVNFVQGPLFVGAAVESTPSGDDGGLFTGKAPSGLDATNYQIGASYKWNDLTVGALYQDMDDVAKWVTVPLSYDLGKVGLRATVQYRDPDADGVSSSTNYALGASYNFSRRTEAFVNVWYDDEATNTFGGAADSTQLGLGLRHSF